MKRPKINEFDFWTLAETLWSQRRRLVRNSLITGVVGLLIAFCIPKEYVSSASLVPEASDGEGNLSGGMGALASMAGINLGGGVDAIGPDLYPKVVSSNEFVVKLLSAHVTTIDNTLSTDYLTYVRQYMRRPWWGWMKVWFSRLMNKINPQPVFTTHDPTDGGINPTRMSREDEKVVEGFKSTVGCVMDEQTGIIEVTFRAQDPLVAKTMVDSITSQLQHFITEYRTGKAKNDLEYYRGLEIETRQAYNRALMAYARYCDSHQGTLLQAYQSEMESLENDMQIAMNAYTQVKQQVQMAEAKVQEKTPAFTIVESASVPNRHASPRKILMTLGWIFLGFVGTAGRIYLKLLFSETRA